MYTAQIDSDIYTVPDRFITDLASIPRPLWFLWSPHESALIAPSILHDYFYAGRIKVTRKYADDVFYYHMLHEGIGKPQAFIFWWGVRVFGNSSFKDASWKKTS